MANLSNINNKFLVTTGGNVLIGQTSAIGSSILQVTGSSTFTPISTVSFIVTNSGNALRLISGVPSGVTWIGKPVQYYASEYSFSTDVTGAGSYSQQFVIENNGDVGIGVSSPIKKLQVSDFETGDLINILCVNRRDQNGDTASIGFSMTDNNLYNKAAVIFERTTTQGRGSLHFATNNTNSSANVSKGDARMTILTNGDVGIGTISPDDKLDVENGNIRLRSNSDGNTGVLRLFDAAGTESGQIYPAAGDLRFYTPNDIIMSPVGNVGIGTTTPAYKTSVFKGGDYNGSEILLDLSIKDTVGGSYNANTGAGISFSSSHWSVSPTEKVMGAIYGANTDGGTAANGYLSLRTRTSDSVTEKMRITGGGQLLLPTTGLNDTRHIILTGTQGTANNACAIGMWGNEARFSSNWYYNGAQRKTVAGNGMAVVGLSTGTTDATTFITFAAAVPTATGGPTEKMRITSPGYVYLGQGFNATNHRINRASTQGSVVLVVSGYGGSGIAADTAIFQATAAGGANAANAGMKIEKNSSTNRSINAAGTVNASGNDYAEYMEKKSTAFEIAAGDICGVNENGKLTNKFTEAHSFVVKSTDPSYVGGDTWGNSVGKKPYLTTQGPIETDAEYAERTAQYETDLANFKVALEAQRIKYDRIAFSGQVPVNITGASVGDYIIPILKEGNLITGETVTSPSFEQYQIAIGKVWKILEDGRAFISVKIV